MEQGRLVSMKINAEIMWLRWVNDQRAFIGFNDNKPQLITNSNGIFDNEATVALLNRIDQNGSGWLIVLKSIMEREMLPAFNDIYGSFMMTDSIKGSLTFQLLSQEIAEEIHKGISKQIASIPQISPIFAPFEKMFSVTTNPNHDVIVDMLMSSELVKQAGTIVRDQIARKDRQPLNIK